MKGKFEAFFLCCILGVFSCSGDDGRNSQNNDIDVTVQKAFRNIAIYNGAEKRVIVSVSGSNLNKGSRYYMLDSNCYCNMFDDAVMTTLLDDYFYWPVRKYQTGLGDHLFIEAFTLGDGYYNAVYVTGNVNLSLASAQNESHLYGHYWGGANLLTVCPGEYSGNPLNVSIKSNSEHQTTGSETQLPSILLEVEAPDACNDNIKSVWLYVFSGDGGQLDPMPSISYDDIINDSCYKKRVPGGNWWEYCDYSNATIKSELQTMTVTCTDDTGKTYNFDEWSFRNCTDWVVNFSDGQLQCD